MISVSLRLYDLKRASSPRCIISWLCISISPLRLSLRIFFVTCIEICFLTRLKRSSFRYLNTKIRSWGIVSTGSRIKGLLWRLGRISLLKWSNMSSGMSFRMNRLCPLLEKVRLHPVRDTLWQELTLLAKHGQNVLSPGGVVCIDM